VRWLIVDAETASENGLVLSEEALPNPRSPGEPKGGSEVILVLWNLGNRGHVGGHGGIPETGCQIGNTDIVQQVNRLLEELPARTQGDGQVVLYPPIGAEVRGSILLLEVEARRAIGQVQGVITGQKHREPTIGGIKARARHLANCRGGGRRRGKARPINVG